MKYKKRLEWSMNTKQTLATIPNRLFAMIIDWISILMIMYLSLRIFSWLGPDIEKVNLENLLEIKVHIEIESKYLSKNAIKILSIIYAFIPIIYFSLISYFTNGQSIGKKIIGIKIISIYHDRLNLWHCTERSLGYIASSLELGLGFLQVFWNHNRMTLHDKIGETVVIKIQKRKKRKNLPQLHILPRSA